MADLVVIVSPLGRGQFEARLEGRVLVESRAAASQTLTRSVKAPPHSAPRRALTRPRPHASLPWILSTAALLFLAAIVLGVI